MATSVDPRTPAAIDNPTYQAFWALRDLGLLLAALALARLATAFQPTHDAATA